MTCIVWIRRSLREYDNKALVEASKEFDEVIPFYVIDENYFSSSTLGHPRVKFWRDSLVELKNLLKEGDKDLVIRQGKPLDQLKRIIKSTEAEKVYFNTDYSPYSKNRDHRVKEELDVGAKSFKDIVMFEKQEITTNSGSPYKVYTYYKKKWFDKQKSRPEKPGNYNVPDISSERIPSLEELGYENDSMDVMKGGRQAGRKKLEEFRKIIASYAEDRDYAWKDSTSKLSPHLKFGTVSIREAFWEAERMKARLEDEDGVKTWQEELAWRDFYFQMLYNYPRSVEEPLQEQFKSIKWRSKEEAADDWKKFTEGRTGFPFVDAGMRQLKSNGWMHNRLRMVVTSFACKDLWFDWKDLHEYYKKMFVDAELSSMIGGIQWAYSIGTDAQPYFRVFNPWTQGEKFDPEGKYIRKWVPELQDVPDEYIHEPYKMPITVQKSSDCKIREDYPRPMVDHDARRKKAIERFENAREE